MRHPLLCLLLLPGCAPRQAVPTVDKPDPRIAVREWSEVDRFNCRRDPAGAVIACRSDADCTARAGDHCDWSEGCSCCTAAPPPVDQAVGLGRYLFGPCDGARCAPPPFCALQPDGTCTMRFNKPVYVWATPFEATGEQALATARRQLCIKVVPHQDCLWRLELPAGSYTADQPFPLHYPHPYECGGRTCNGEPAIRATPKLDLPLQARVIVDGCGGGGRGGGG